MGTAYDAIQSRWPLFEEKGRVTVIDGQRVASAEDATDGSKYALSFVDGVLVLKITDRDGAVIREHSIRGLDGTLTSKDTHDIASADLWLAFRALAPEVGPFGMRLD